MKSVVYVGLDVHKDSIVIAVAREGREPAETWKTIPYDGVRLRKALKLLVERTEDLRVCYEAGPTGYELQRLLTSLGISCQVIAPALVPRRPGVRVKTDRRDAESLARFLRAEELTAIRVPTVEEEAIRDLVRLREDLKADVLRARHRLSKFLLRQGRIYAGTSWTQAHLLWLRKQEFPHEALALTFEHYLTAMREAGADIERPLRFLDRGLGTTVPRPGMLRPTALRTRRDGSGGGARRPALP